jgi:hypothetical protein
MSIIPLIVTFDCAAAVPDAIAQAAASTGTRDRQVMKSPWEYELDRPRQPNGTDWASIGHRFINRDECTIRDESRWRN